MAASRTTATATPRSRATKPCAALGPPRTEDLRNPAGSNRRGFLSTDDAGIDASRSNPAQTKAAPLPGRRFVLGDVITGVNGQAIRNVDDLLDRVEAEPLGSTVRLEVLRNGERTTVPLRLEASSGRSV